MECLRDFVSVKTCSSTLPEGGVYINQLPGIEIKEIDEIAKPEQAGWAGAWADIQNRALRRFKTDVIAEFGRRFKLRQITQSVDLGQTIDTTKTTAVGANWRGLTIELNRETDQLVSSNMQTIRVEYVKIFLSAPANFNVKVFNLELGTVVDTFAVTGVAGWNTITVNKFYPYRRIFIGYDATAVTSVTLDLSQFNTDGFDNCAWTPGGNVGGFPGIYWYLGFGMGCGCQARIRGGSTSTLGTSFTSVTDGVNTFGMTCTFSTRCVYDTIVCKNRDHFLNAWLYCLACELMTERVASAAISSWTTVDAGKAKELRKYFEANYKGGILDDIRYEGELYLAVQGINIDKNDCCIECDDTVRFIDSMM